MSLLGSSLSIIGVSKIGNAIYSDHSPSRIVSSTPVPPNLHFRTFYGFGSNTFIPAHAVASSYTVTPAFSPVGPRTGTQKVGLLAFLPLSAESKVKYSR